MLLLVISDSSGGARRVGGGAEADSGDGVAADGSASHSYFLRLMVPRRLVSGIELVSGTASRTAIETS